MPRQWPKSASPGASTYASTKGGVVALARSAAVEYAPQGIRVNVVNPGPVETPMALEGFGSRLMRLRR